MTRSVTLCTLQWGNLSLGTICQKAKEFEYDGVELGLPDHVDVRRTDTTYYQGIKGLLKKYDLRLYAISTHLVGQAVCNNIDERHKAILPSYIWEDSDPEGVHQRVTKEMIRTAHAAKMLGVDTVIGFTGSSIWYCLYSFPPVTDAMMQKGYDDFARHFTPILDGLQKLGVRFTLGVHPTEIAFDTLSACRALEAVDNHPAFGFNYDPSHLGCQGMNYVGFIYQFPERIFHVHMGDIRWSDTPKQVSIFGGHVTFDNPRRYWSFRSLGRKEINFEEIIRALNSIGYQGLLSVEWGDSAMDQERGARESYELVERMDFQPPVYAFDACFGKE